MRRGLSCLMALFVGSFFAAAGAVSGAAEPVARRPMEIEDLCRFLRVADPQISPDGTQIVWQVTTVNPEANGSATGLWIAPADGSARRGH